MVMDYLPPRRFRTVDVRDAMLDRDPLSGKLKLSALDTQFVRKVSSDPNEPVTQSDPSFSGDLGHLLKGFLDLAPTDFPPADRVHGRGVGSLRPDVCEPACIAVGHQVNPA